MVRRLVILPALTKTLAASTTLAADPDVTGQTLTPSNYVGFPAAGCDAMTYLLVGKPGVAQSLEVVLVDLDTRPWPLLARSVNHSPLAAHDATHGIQTCVPPDGLAQLVGAYLGTSLVDNTDELFFDGAAFTLIRDSGGVRVGLSGGGGGGASGSGSGGGGGSTASRSAVSTAAAPAPKRQRAATALALTAAVSSL